MSETYLDGKITVSSLAAPTEEDLALIGNLSDAERKQMLFEAIEKGANSPVVDTSMEEIWQNALIRYKAMHAVSAQ